MTSTPMMNTDIVTIEQTEIKVRWHESRGSIVIDSAQIAGTGKDYDIDINQRGEVIQQLSGRF